MADVRSSASHPGSKQQAASDPKGETLVLQSSFLQSASYDPAAYQLTMNLKSGHQIVYWYVYPSVWEQFKQAPSKGSFYSLAIKGKHQSFTLKRPMLVSDLEKAKHGGSSWFRKPKAVAP